jgi:hypothetical protein
MPPEVFGRLAVATTFHVAIYLTTSWYLFSDKEV